jgi:hypothetical protein
MKQTKLHQILALLLLMSAVPTHAQTTAFTYQGQLKDAGSPAGGTYDLRFTIYNLSSGGSAVGAPITNAPVSTTNGLFTVILDFGAGVFNGADRWLEMGVRTNGSAGSYTVLSPRQPLTAAPYALYATNAGSATFASGVASGSVTAVGIASGQVVKSLNGLKDNLIFAAGANVTLATNGNSLTISSTGGGAVFALNGTNAYYTAGNVGVGTSSPSSPLDVQKTNASAIIRAKTSGTGSAALFLDRGSASSAYGSQISFITTGVSDFAIGTSQGAAGISDFSIYDYGTSANVLTIAKSSGHVGIGTAALQANSELTIDAGANNPIFMRCSGTSEHEWAMGPFVGPGIGFGIYDYTAASARIKIDNSGNIGIGTTTPVNRLSVSGNADFNNILLNGYNWSITTSGDTHWGFGISSSGANYFTDARIAGTGNNDRGFRVLDANTGDVRLFVGGGGNVGIGTTSPSTLLEVNGEAKMCVLSITGGCDVSEPFRISSQNIPKGSLVTIDKLNPGQLKLSDQPYDKRVAGIVSGANGINPGISLSQQGVLEGGQNVALSGRVYALADASQGEIEPGDLLTTSSTPGHCMKATDASKAQGAIIGKAMSALPGGKGMVLVLVSLQ